MTAEGEHNPQTWGKLQHWFIDGLASKKPSFDLPVGGSNGRQKVDYQMALVTASKSMIRFKKPEHLIRMIVRTIDELLKVSHTAVLLYKQKKDAYVLIDSKGMEGHKIPVGYLKLVADNPLIRVFSEKRSYILDSNGALIYSNVQAALRNDTILVKNHGIKERLLGIKKEMERLRAEICIPSFFKRRLLGVLVLGRKLSGEPFSQEEVNFFITLANDTSMAISNAQLIESLQDKVKEIIYLYEKERQLFVNTTIALATAIDARDPYTHGHTERVTHYSLAISDELMPYKDNNEYRKFRETLQISALLHDIGKIGIPDYVLSKASQLTREEYDKVKEHPNIGASILHPIKELRDAVQCVKYHQEWYNGRGYPDGLQGNQIPLAARIIAAADAFDAITTDRPYRKKRSIEIAVEEIKIGSGTQFDPKIVEAFLRAYHKGGLFASKKF